MGNTAAAAIAGERVAITKYRSGPPKRSARFDGVAFIPTFHPANCLRNADSFPGFTTDFQKVKDVLNGRSKATDNGRLGAGSRAWSPPAFRAFDIPTKAELALRQVQSYDPLVIDIETGIEKDTEFSHLSGTKLLCVGIGYTRGGCIIIGERALQASTVRKVLADTLANARLICHNGKYDLAGLEAYLELPPQTLKLYFDTMLASYILDERRGVHGLKYLATELLGAPDYAADIKQYTTGTKADWSAIPKDKLYQYNAYDCALTYELYERFSASLAREPH